ncbi:MAG: glycosyl hydrolase 53 family protein [Janthinobacterium lividum]
MQINSFRANSFLPLAALLSGLLLAGADCPAQAQEYHPVPTARKFPYVGSALSDQPRLARVPGRVYDDFAGKPTNLPAFLASNHFNAVRLLVNVTQPPTAGVDNRDIDHREANYLLDFGGEDWQVAEARQAKKLGQRVVLTLQFGQEKPLGADNWHEFIPDAWLGLNYVQTLGKIDSGTRRMLLPFLKAGIQPDMLIIENESDSGMLFQTVDTHGKMTVRNDRTTDPFSGAATGNFSIWPKCAGYYKREILSAKDAIKQAGFDPARTRIAVHGSTTPGHARFLFNNIFRNKPDAESVYYSGGTPKGVVSAVPASLRKLRLADMVDVMGFSFYPDPPHGGTKAAFDASLRQMNDDLAYYNTVLPGYGRYAAGPFRGQAKKQSLVIEFGVPTDAAAGFTGPRQGQFVTAFFDSLAAYPWTLGALWWEPGYARNNWAHGEGSLYRTTKLDPKHGDYAVLKPVATIKTWGAFAAPK